MIAKVMKHKTKEVKTQAVTRYMQGDDVAVICREYQIVPLTLKNWVNKAKEEAFLTKEFIKPKPSEMEGIVARAQKTMEGYTQRDYATGSIQVSAFLLVMGKEISSISDGIGGRKIIHFPYDDEIMNIVSGYFNGKAQCSPYAFFNKMNEVKEMVMPPRV